MADTTFIKTTVEPYVRGWLSTVFVDTVFQEKQVLLRNGRPFKFDAVSNDGTVVANIVSSRPTTRTGRENTGGVRKALNDLRYLMDLPRGVRSVLVFTDSGFRDLMMRRGKRMGIESIQILVCPLPKEVSLGLSAILDAASQEQRGADNTIGRTVV